ncbi:hypothetical protein [Kamptonema formosum]|uniref:hypothetical protein n=1 Tax=Kamptonema formosum TaxID=331992 RepID=UPI0012DE5EDB|nr:hypothetical protein [Oscillatoria sp. PCC 10802]
MATAIRLRPPASRRLRRSAGLMDYSPTGSATKQPRNSREPHPLCPIPGALCPEIRLGWVRAPPARTLPNHIQRATIERLSVA